MMKLMMLCATAHQALVLVSRGSEEDESTYVVTANISRPKKYSGLRPTVSEIRPNKGWKAVEVSRKAVESHDAALDAWK